MVFSSLSTRSAVTSKRSSRHGRAVSRLIIHHVAGTSDEGAIRELTTHPTRKVSASYILLRDGTLVGCVPEESRPWTSGGFTADGPSITVETVNVSGAPEWRVSDAQLERLAELAADLSIRYGWGPLTRKNVIGHREVAQTDCPGPYLWPRLPSIVERANQIRSARLAGGAPAKPAQSAPVQAAPATSSYEWPGAALRVDGVRGPITVRAWQRLLGGIGKYSGLVDGVWGPMSVTGFQRWLASLGHYTGRIDGSEGPMTIKALQRFLTAKGLYGGLVDGSRGPLTVRAEQGYLNAQAPFFRPH